MADFSTVGGSQKYHDPLVNYTFSIGEWPTSGAANTKGAWLELSSSIGEDWESLILTMRQATLHTSLLDIGVGGSGSEVVIVPDVFLGTGTTGRNIHTVELPVNIPKGSRVAVRGQSVGASQSMVMTVTGKTNSLAQTTGYQKHTSYGIVSGTSSGTFVDCGATTNTKGSWTQIESSTSEAMKRMVICLGSKNTATADADYLIDIAIGGSGSEEIIIPDIAAATDSTLDGIYPGWLPYSVDIPAGTRIAVRGQCSSNSTNTRDFYISFIGSS